MSVSDVRGFGEGTSMGVRGRDVTLPKFLYITRLILNYVCASVFVQITSIYFTTKNTGIALSTYDQKILSPKSELVDTLQH